MVERSRAPLASSRPSLHHGRNRGVGGVRFMQRRAAARVQREKKRASPMPCSPGTTASAAACRGGRSKERRPILTAYGSARSCCSRRRSRRCCRATISSCAAGPTWRHWHAPSSVRCSPPGPASAITRVRATCMPARAWWRSGTAAGSRRTRPDSASCRASATIPPLPSRPSPSASARRRSTAISSGWWRGFSP